MRAVYFFISLFFLLLGGTHNTYAAAQHDAHKAVHHDLAKNHHNKFAEKNTDSTIIEDSDFDPNEESFNASSVKASAGNFFIHKNNLVYAQYFTCFYFNNYFTTVKSRSAANGLSSPIYIVNRVLRI